MLAKIVNSGSEGAAINSLNTIGLDEINAIDGDNLSLLSLGARRGLTTFCQKLLEHNFLKEATVRTVSNSGESAVHLAAKHGWPSTVTALVTHPRMRELARSTNGRTPLHCAAEEGHSLVVKALLGCPNFQEVNVQDTLGYTALHLAAGQGHAAVCSILLGSPRFTSANVKDWKGWTALHCAAEHGHDEACSALLGSGRCHVVAMQQDCLSALQLARGRGHVSTCELLRLHPAFSEPGTRASDATSAAHEAFEERCQSFDAIVAKLKAIPEVTGGREVASSEVLPEAEPIGSLLWRLSELQAQLQDVSPEPTSRSPSPTARRVPAEALPSFGLRKEQKEVPESELMNLPPPLLSTPARCLQEQEGIQSPNEGAKNKAAKEVASSVAFAATAEQKTPVEPAVVKEAALPAHEQKRQYEQQPQPEPPQPGTESLRGTEGPKAGGAEFEAPKPKEVQPPFAVQEMHEQQAQVEPAVPVVPGHNGQQQQQPQAEPIEIQANIKDVKDVIAEGSDSKATKDVALPAAFETTAEAPVGSAVAKEPAPDLPEEGVESHAETQDLKDAKDVKGGAENKAAKEVASSVAFAATAEQKQKTPVEPAVVEEAALPAHEQKRQYEQQPQPEPPQPGTESLGGTEGAKDPKAGGAEFEAPKPKEVQPPFAVQEMHEQQAQVEPAVGKELAPAVGEEPAPSAREQEGQWQQQPGADAKDGKVRGEEEKTLLAAAEAPKQEVLLEAASEKDAAQPPPEQKLESSQPDSPQASESGSPVMSSTVLNVRQARRLRKAGQPRPVTPR